MWNRAWLPPRKLCDKGAALPDWIAVSRKEIQKQRHLIGMFSQGRPIVQRNRLKRVALSADQYSVKRRLLIMGARAKPAILISNLETLAFETAETPMWVYDVKSLVFLAVNEEAVRHYGYSRDEFLGMTILDIRPAEDVIAILRETLGSGRHNSDQERWPHRTKAGKLIEVEITSREVIFHGHQAEIVAAEVVSAP
jgi:PAS domain S-box-containing protein